MLLRVRWYVAYSLTLRDLEEMMAERAPSASIIRRCIAGSSSWCRCSRRRLAVTNARQAGVDAWMRRISRSKAGGDISTRRRTRRATPSIFRWNQAGQGCCAALLSEGHGSKRHARDSNHRQERFQFGRASCGECQARDAHQDSSSKVLNNVVEQDHRAIKHLTRPMLGFKDFDSAHVILSGIEVMHMIKKGPMNCWEKAHCLPPSSSTHAFHT